MATIQKQMYDELTSLLSSLSLFLISSPLLLSGTAATVQRKYESNCLPSCLTLLYVSSLPLFLSSTILFYYPSISPLLSLLPSISCSSPYVPHLLSSNPFVLPLSLFLPLPSPPSPFSSHFDFSVVESRVKKRTDYKNPKKEIIGSDLTR